MKKYTFQKKAIACVVAFSSLTACQGSGNVPTNISFRPPSTGSNLKFGNNTVNVKEVAADGSYILISSDINNFQETSIDIRLNRVTDNIYVYENEYVKITLSASANIWSASWDNKNGSSIREIFNSFVGDSVIIDVYGLYAGSSGVYDPNVGRRTNMYPLLRTDPHGNLLSHYNFSVSNSSDGEILYVKSNNGLEFYLRYNTDTGLFELDTNEGPYTGYKFRMDPISGEFYYEAPVLVGPDHMGDTSGLVEWYGYDAVSSSISSNSSIDFSSFHVVSANADFTEGVASTEDVKNRRASFENAISSYYDEVSSLGLTWMPDIDIDFSYQSINVDGLEAAHSAGWSGLGTHIRFLDNFPSGNIATVNDYGYVEFTHGGNTYAISKAIAPEAYFVLDDFNNLSEPWKNTNTVVGTVNMSLGWHISDSSNPIDGNIAALSFINNYLSVVAAKNPYAVIVESAGNNGGIAYSLGVSYGCVMVGSRFTADSCTDVKFALDEVEYNYLDRTLFVGAYDDLTGNLTSYSVSAGNSMDHFIVADGSSILDSGSGTSYAAPRVTGALALVAQKFPQLTAQQRKLVVLHTADDLGAVGVDSKFGHGLLNVDNALNPIGRLH